MKKKIMVLLFSVVLCLCMAAPVFAEQTDGFADKYERVLDQAGLLSDREEAALADKLNELSKKQKNGYSHSDDKHAGRKDPARLCRRYL